MSCRISTAPINVSSSISNEGGEKTNFYYNYGNSSCSVTNKGTYLDISCFDGNNQCGSGLTGNLFVTNVRLYSPSINKYDGAKAEAELIITHTGGGKHLYLCIPINSTSGGGSSVSWFNQIIPYSPSSNGSTKAINVSSFSLNSIIPKAELIVYEGGTFPWGCNNGDSLLAFKGTDSVYMSNRNLTALRKLISPASFNVQNSPDYVKINRNGTKAGPGKKSGSSGSSTLTCTPIIDQNGNNLENPDGTTWTSNKTFGGGVNLLKYWQIILGVILGIIVLIGIVMGIRKMRSVAGGSTGTNAGANTGNTT